MKNKTVELVGRLTPEGDVRLTIEQLPVFIRQLRQAKNLTQQELADAIGYEGSGKKIICEIEAGTRNLGIKTLMRTFGAMGGEVEIVFKQKK